MVTTTSLSVSLVSGGGVTTWTKAVGLAGSVGADDEIWYGKVTTPGTSTITVTWSGSVSGDVTEYSAQEFSSSAGSGTTWAVDHPGTLNNSSSSTVTYPSLSPSGSAELYLGFSVVANYGASGSTSGFTYALTSTDNVVTYDTNASSPSAYQPTATQSPAEVSSSLGALFTATSTGTGSPIFYVDDALGSTQSLLNLSGSVVGSYGYSTYGNTLTHTGTSSTPIQFDGAYTDSETGFLYLINRYYDPVTGEFQSIDPKVATTGEP